MRLITLFFVIAIGCCAARPKVTEGPRRALVTIEGMDVNGKIMLEQASVNSPVKIRGVIYGLEPGRHGLHVHSGTTLGENCENVGGQFVPSEKFDTERPAGYLGNVKTFSGSPSRTDINLISSLVSLYEDSTRSIVERALVIHAQPDDWSRARKASVASVSFDDNYLACGLIRTTEIEQSIQLNLEKPYKVDKIEQSILDGEKTWENVRHPYFGASNVDERSKIPSNLNLEGVERRYQDVDSLTLETTVPTRKIWQTGYTYEYDYAGWTSTGIMGISTKVTGGSIKGRLVIEPVEESTLNVALLNTKAKQFNEDVMEKYSEVDPGQEVRIQDQEHLEKPWQIKILSGKVESVAIGKEEPLWIVNFKRALAAQIQFQLDEASGVFQKDEYNNYYAENTVYHTLEGAPTGECQTWYHISPLPQEAVEAQPDLLPVPELCENFPVYEIIKNRDMDSCRILPIFQYNSNQGYDCDITNGAGCENDFSHTDITRIIGCTHSQGHFIVQRIHSYDKYVQKPFSYETEATEGLTIQYFNLKSATPTGYSKLVSRINQDVHVYQTLAYSYDSDYQTHGPLMGKPSLRESNSPMVLEVEPEVLKKEAQRLFSEIYADLESESYYFDPSTKHTSDKYNMLRRVFANFDYPELYAFIEKYWEKTNSKDEEFNFNWSTKNQILFDTLIFTGSNPALLIAQQYITKGYVPAEFAAQAISAVVPNVETPTKELLSSFYDFLRSEYVQSHRQVEITTALALSRLVYQACVNTTFSLNMFPKLVMGEFCSATDSIVTNQLVPFFYEQIKTASDASERIAYLTALGNIGHEVIVPYLKPYITSCEPSSTHENEWYERNQRDLVNLSKKEMRKKWVEARKTLNQKNVEEDDMYTPKINEEYEDDALCNIVRTKAIFALAHLAIEQKEIVSSLLMPIYFNKAEETEVRLAALSLLFVSNPPQAFWNRVALSTWYEPNDQVAHFIYTTIASKVANKDPVDRESTFRAEAALPLMKPFFWTSYVALNYFKAGYAEKYRLGYVWQTTNFPGYESFFPSHHYNSLYINAGPWYTKLYEFAIDAKHPEKFIDRLFGKPGVRFSPNKDESSITSPELEKIHDELKIEARATGQPEIYLYLNFFDNYQRFYSFNPNNIYKTIQKQIIQKALRENSGKFEINYHKYISALDTFTRIPSAMGLAYTSIKHHSYFFSVKSQLEGSFSFSNFNAKFEGYFKPAFVKKMTYRLMAETPFARTYPTTGVDFEFAFTFPGKYYIEGDYKTGKVQANWEFFGDKQIQFAKYSVVPFNTIRKITDFTPAFLLAETKNISYTEQPKEEKYSFGQQFFGMNFFYQVKSDVHAHYQSFPYNEDFFGTFAFFTFPSTLRQHEKHLYFDAPSSETKAIKTYFSWSAKSDSKFDTPLSTPLHSQKLFDTVYGDKIKSNQWVNQQEQEWHSQKFQHIFKSLTNPTGYTFDFSAEFTGKTSRRFGSAIAYGMDTKAHRGSLMMEKRSELNKEEGDNFVFCADFDAQFPDSLIFKRKEMLQDDYEPYSQFKIGFGKSCTDDRKIEFTTKWTRSEDQVTPNIRAKWQKTQCSKHDPLGRGQSDECVAARRLASYLNKGVTVVNFNELPPFVYNATYKFQNLFRHFYGPYMSDNRFNVQNQQNQITIEKVYYPLIGSMDVKFYYPEENVFYYDIDVHPIAEVFLPKRMAVPRSVLAAPGVCLIGSETVTTFDGLFYNATFSGCDQLLTKDCSGRYQFAVLSREENNNKIVTVLLDNEKIEVFPSQQKVKVNGMDISVSSQSYSLKNSKNEIVAVIKKTADNFVEVDSPITHMIKVLTDAKEVVVMGSPIHRGRLCGLCGSQTGNKLTDLEGPRQCSIPRDLMDAAYELKSSPAGCKSNIKSSDVSELRRIQEECLKEKSENVWGISDVTPIFPKWQQNVYSSQATRRFPTQWTVYRNKMVVQDGKRCFSTESVPKCAEGSQPSSTQEMKLGFHCVPKNVLSEKLSEELSRRPLDELMGKEIDFVRVFTVPTNCINY